MSAHVLYDTTTGEARSIGTVVVDPIPEGMTDKPITDDEFDGLVDGSKVWDSPTRTVVVNQTRIAQLQAIANAGAIRSLIVDALATLQQIIDAPQVVVTSVATAQSEMRKIQTAVVLEARVLRRLVRLVAEVLDGTE